MIRNSLIAIMAIVGTTAEFTYTTDDAGRNCLPKACKYGTEQEFTECRQLLKVTKPTCDVTFTATTGTLASACTGDSLQGKHAYTNFFPPGFIPMNFTADLKENRAVDNIMMFDAKDLDKSTCTQKPNAVSQLIQLEIHITEDGKLLIVFSPDNNYDNTIWFNFEKNEGKGDGVNGVTGIATSYLLVEAVDETSTTDLASTNDHSTDIASTIDHSTDIDSTIDHSTDIDSTIDHSTDIDSTIDEIGSVTTTDDINYSSHSSSTRSQSTGHHNGVLNSTFVTSLGLAITIYLNH